MDRMDKSQLLEQFSTYLDSADLDVTSEPEPCDLHTLFAELAALRTEVKTQARQTKSALDDFRLGYESLRQANDRLNHDLGDARQQLARQQRATERVFLLELLDMHDRQLAAVTLLQGFQPGEMLLRRSRKKDKALILSLQQGQDIALRRLEQTLRQHQVTPMEVLDCPVDPHSMTVIEVEHRSDCDDGMVTAELRRGFYWREEILRPAEVKVNKREHA
jgi:molecular chaperone GrpE